MGTNVGFAIKWVSIEKMKPKNSVVRCVCDLDYENPLKKQHHYSVCPFFNKMEDEQNREILNPLNNVYLCDWDEKTCISY